MRILIGLILAALLQAESAKGLSPEEAAVYCLGHNKDLLAARHLIAAAEGKLVQAGLWKNPDFEMLTELDVNRREGERTYEGGFVQRFPWSGRLAKARSLARVDVAMAVAELRDKERLLAGNVLSRARAILVIERKLQLKKENVELLEKIFQQTRALIANGMASPVDARVVELEKTVVNLSYETQVVELNAKLAELNGLLGRAPTQPLVVTGTLPAAPDESVLKAAMSRAVARRPDRRLAALQVDRAEAERRLAEAERWEDVGVGASVIRKQQDGMNETMVGFSLSVPLPLWNRNQGRIAESQAVKEQAIAGVAALDLTIMTEVRDAQVRITGLASVLARTRGPALELARNTTKLNEETYGAGTSSFLTVFESQKQRLAIELMAVEAEEQLAAAISEWETRSGHFPERVVQVLSSRGGAGKAAVKRGNKPAKAR